MYDFSRPQHPIKTRLYAGDTETHISIKSIHDAEDLPQQNWQVVPKIETEAVMSYDKCANGPNKYAIHQLLEAAAKKGCSF